VIDPTLRALFQALISHLKEGRAMDQIAREMDFPQSYLEQLLLNEVFLEFFGEVDPEGYASWTYVHAEEEADQEVQAFLRSKAFANARALQELVDSGNLKAADELRIREILLKMSGTLKEEAAVEVVKISTQHLAALREAGAEVDALR